MIDTLDRTRTSRHPAFAMHAWRRVAADTDVDPPAFDPASLDGLPAPARRLLAHALPAGVPLSSTVVLQMVGSIKLGRRWFPFRADQIVRRGIGLVWSAVIGGPIVRFVGADVVGPDVARTEFRLHNRIPVVRTSGTGIRRSGLGRLAAETVVWLPQALTPQMGAKWSAVNDRRATVSIRVAEETVDVDVTVGGDGQIRWLDLRRWDESATPPGLAPFGGSVTAVHTAPNGVRIARSGVVGWDWRSPRDPNGVFFEYRITAASFDAPPLAGGRDG